MLDFFIHSAVTHHAAVRPDHPALSCQGRELSYAELETRSNRLAHTLRSGGLQSGDRVGIFMHKALELGVAIYGILKAGGVFVPLDPFLPVARLAFILDDCEIRHVVSGDSLSKVLRQLFEAHGAGRTLRVYGVDQDVSFPSVPWAAIDAAGATPLASGLIDLDLGYLMYTSGSTGVPKGMMHTHRGSLSYARWGALHVGLRPEDRVASHAPLHFDLSIFDFFSTAQAGATVVLVPEPVTKFPASFSKYVEDERISVVFTVPFTLIDVLERGAMSERDLGSLRWILFGGEPFPPKHLRALMEELPGVRFTNVYGPAEAPSCTCHDVPPPADWPAGADKDAIPIGTVSHNSEDLILDEDDNECGIGEPGELLIRSSTLTRGYWKRADLNARVFYERPGHGPFPDVFFRTGDLVVRHDDGQLRFLGRKDRMVKTRGHRVELDEVEAALARHDEVLEAAAFAVPDGRGSKVIEAAVTLRPAAASAATGDEVLVHARSQLPGYAVPRVVTVVSAFPRTTSGKIDRQALAAGRAPEDSQ